MNKNINRRIGNIRGKASRHKILIQNFSYLSALRIFSLLIPLFTYPYLIKALGKETYGLVIFAQAIAGYFVVLIDFGFDISATNEVSIHRNDKQKLNEIFSSVLLIKTILFAVSFLILFIILYSIPLAENNKLLFILSMWVGLNSVIFPSWYFQGIEDMKYITYLTLISKVIFFGLIFILIHTPKDYLFLPLINGVGSLTAGIISMVIVFRKHKLRFSFQPASKLTRYFISSFPIFLSNISIQLYVRTNKVIVGSFLGMTEVAYYDLGEKIIALLRIPQSILGQALFPKMSKEKNIGFIKQIFKISVLFNLGIFVLILLTSKYLVLFWVGQHMLKAVVVINILAITIPFIAMSNIFGIQILLSFGYKRTFTKVILMSGLLYFFQAFVIWISIGFTMVNVSLITVITEIYVTSFMFYYCKKLNLWIK